MITQKNKRQTIVILVICAVIFLGSIYFERIMETANIIIPQAEQEQGGLVFDALQYISQDGTKFQEIDIIELYGEPNDRKEWDYSTTPTKKYEVSTLKYGDIEFLFW